MFDSNTPVPAGYRRDPRRTPQPRAYFLDELKGKVLWGAMHPDCCHFLCQVLERRKPEGMQMIFTEVKDQICILMIDRLGSDVLEKLYQVCDDEQMDHMVFSVTANVDVFKAVCFDSRGSKSMKKFIECLRTPEQKSHMISIFKGLIVPLVNDEIGVDVIRHCLKIFPEKHPEILDVITDNFVEIATKRSGSFLLREVLVSRGFEQESRQLILSEIIANVHRLYFDGAGCHLVANIIANRMEDGVRDLVARLTGSFTCLAMNKHAASVVMRLMKTYKEEYAPQIINEIMYSSDFSRVLLNPYGKDVIEDAKKCSTGTVLKSLNHQIALHSDHARSHCHRENILPTSHGTVHKILNHRVPLRSDHSRKTIKPKWKI